MKDLTMSHLKSRPNEIDRAEPLASLTQRLAILRGTQRHQSAPLGRFGFLTAPVTFAAAAAVALVAGCASTPQPNAALEEARAAYREASANPQVARTAELPLRRAQEALQEAENAQNAKAEPALVTHAAYLSRQRSLAAIAVAQQASAQESISAAGREREQVLVESRTQEADKARANAEQERLAAQQAQRTAEQAQRSAQQAGQTAEQRARELALAQQQVASEGERARQLAAELADMKARPTERGMVLTLGDVLFDTAEATLRPGAMRSIDRLAMFLSQHNERRVLIEGYTDSVGRDDYNQQLSERRANAVRQALLQRNVPSERIQIRGMGEADPVATNDTAAGRQQNRRVEVLFSDERGAIAGQLQQ